MKRILTIFTMIGFIFVLTGCVDEDEFTAMREGIANLESEVSSLQTQLETNEANLGLAEEKIAQLELDLETEQNDLDAAELALIDAQADLASAQADLASAEEALNDAQADINLTQADLDLVEADLTEAQANLDLVEDELATAQADLLAAETAIETAAEELANAQSDLTWQIHEESTHVTAYALDGEIYFDFNATLNYYGTVHIYEGALNSQPEGFENTSPYRIGLTRSFKEYEAGYYQFTVVIYSNDINEAPHYRTVEVTVGEYLLAEVDVFYGDVIIDFSNPNFDIDLVGYLQTEYDRYATPIELNENIIYETDLDVGEYVYTVIWQHVYDDGYEVYTEYHYEEFHISIDPYFVSFTEVDFVDKTATFEFKSNMDYASIDVYQDDVYIDTLDSIDGNTYTTPQIDIEGDILFSFDVIDENGNVIYMEFAIVSVSIITQYTLYNDGTVTFDFSNHGLGAEVVNYRIIEMSEWIPFVYDLQPGETSMNIGGFIDGWVVTYELIYADADWNIIHVESVDITFIYDGV